MSGATIKVLYFAQVAEMIGHREEQWPLESPTTGADWLRALHDKYPVLGGAERLKLAINQFHVGPDAIITPGDEVAVFEPVTGG